MSRQRQEVIFVFDPDFGDQRLAAAAVIKTLRLCGRRALIEVDPNSTWLIVATVPVPTKVKQVLEEL